MSILENINLIIGIAFALCYVYQTFYILVPFIVKPKPRKEAVFHNIGILISARNEEDVIGQLLDSIASQDYPADRLKVFLAADNCTDDTAAIARGRGAVVYERFNNKKVGKGFALSYLLGCIDRDFGLKSVDAFVVLDADNVLEPDYITEMNRTYSGGYRIATSYRNSKNYGTNWISAGYALWFLREAKYLNNSRMLLGTSCAVSGTGFLFAREILEERGGWNYFLLTEDIEFTCDSIVKGEMIGYCGSAMLYDEQPETFQQSWNQRLRWAKGVFAGDEKARSWAAAGNFFQEFLLLLRYVHDHLPCLHRGDLQHCHECRGRCDRADGRIECQKFAVGTVPEFGCGLLHAAACGFCHHGYGVEEYPLHLREKGVVSVYFPAVHVYLHPYFRCCAV